MEIMFPKTFGPKFPRSAAAYAVYIKAKGLDVAMCYAPDGGVTIGGVAPKPVRARDARGRFVRK